MSNKDKPKYLTEEQKIKKHLSVMPIWMDDLKIMGIVTEYQLKKIKKKFKVKFSELSLTEFKQLPINLEYEDLPTFEWKKNYGYNKELFWKAFNLASLLRGQYRFGKMKILLPNRKKDFMMLIDASNGHKKFYVCLAPRILGERI